MTIPELNPYTQHMLDTFVAQGLATKQEVHTAAMQVYLAMVATHSHDNHYIPNTGKPTHIDYGTAMQMIEAGGAMAYAKEIELKYVAMGFPQEVFNIPLWRIMNHIATSTTTL